MSELVFKGANNQALTNSLLVAKEFGKEHKHVLEAIRNLLGASAEDSAFVENQGLAKMFELNEQEIPMPVGDGTKKTPVYLMNRDGFTLLAMGFTGKKAMQFKIAYIEAFNKMEEEIRKSVKPMSQLEILQMSVNQLVEQEKRITNVEKRLDDMETERKTNANLLLEVKLSENKVPKMTDRKRVMQLINQYYLATNTPHKAIWHKINQCLYYNYGISVNSYKRKPKDTGLDVAQEHGYIDKILDIVSDMIEKVNNKNKEQ